MKKGEKKTKARKRKTPNNGGEVWRAIGYCSAAAAAAADEREIKEID